MSLARMAQVTDRRASPARPVLLEESCNLWTGTRALRRLGPTTTLEEDLLFLAASVYAADVTLLRGDRENHTRDIDIEIQVVNRPVFEALHRDLEIVLYLLSHDNWRLTFVPVAGVHEGHSTWSAGPGSVLLFSGGLDSLAWAVSLAEGGNSFVLVSHDSGNPVAVQSQRALCTHVNEAASSQVGHIPFRVCGRSSSRRVFPPQREPTQRTRSFLFLALGALAARRTGVGQTVYIAENGQLAVNLPLTAARIGAFSTHTAHPEVVAKLQAILSAALSFELRFVNPLLNATKAEAIAHLCHHHREAIPNSTSCWRAWTVRDVDHHCGVCVPCIIRRIALEYNGFQQRRWQRDLLREDPSMLPDVDEGKRNLVELLEFVARFSTDSDSALVMEYPELVNRFFSQSDTIEMYRRFSSETMQVLSAYPDVLRLVS